MDFFFTKSEKERLAKWEYSVIDNSLSTKIFTPLWDWLVTLIPETVAPNILTLAGFLSTLYGYHLCYNYLGDNNVFSVGLTAIMLTFTYMNLDAIDGKHARKTRNSSPLGELFDHSCDNVGVVFMLLTLTSILGVKDVLTQWYIVQIGQLLFLNAHIDAFTEKVVRFGYLTGSGEFLLLDMGLMLTKITVGFGWLEYLINPILCYYEMDGVTFFQQTASIIYYTILVIMFIKISSISNHYSTRNGLLISLLARFVPSILIYLGYESSNLTIITVISHGLIMSVITGDMIVSKMANRELHPFVPIMIIISLFDNFLCGAICIIYYVLMLFELSHYLKIPMFGVNQTVFCCGVYDVLHLGHMNSFINAKEMGTKLIVGVHNDEDCTDYKRKPYNDHDYRVDNVSKCKGVDKVIANCPMILTKEFIKEHNINIVICSEEYNNDKDDYYRAAREMGILKIVKRTQGVSTSDIIGKIVERSKS